MKSELSDSLQRAFDNLSKSKINIPEIGKKFQISIPPGLFELQKVTESIAQQLAQQFKPITIPAFNPLVSDFAERMQRFENQRVALEKAGWLPHYTTPFKALDAEKWRNVDTFIETYYTTEWAATRQAFTSRLPRYDIDDEAKDTFSEALRVHEIGCYRLVARGLFPEIERVARIELHEGKTDSPITSQHDLIKLAGGLTSGDTEPEGYFGFMLYGKLADHIYARCDEANIENIINDPVPNRHAAIHGYASYPTHKSSINALILTDFVFQVITAVKRIKRENSKAA